MAIAFDTSTNITRVEFYDESAGTTTALTVTDFDIFSLDASVGDAMVFCIGTHTYGYPWHNIYLEISTPLDIDASLKWYYLNDGAWNEFSLTADDTSSFTKSGWIEFDTPLLSNEWTSYPGRLTYPIKCEIDTLNSITAVGHVNATPIIKDWTINITGSETMSNVMIMDTSEGWGVVEQDGDNSYIITANLRISGEGTELISTNEIVQVGTDTIGRSFWLITPAILQLGEIDGDGRTSGGSNWYYTSNNGSYPYVNWTGVLKMYLSSFYHRSDSGRDMYFGATTVLDWKDSTFRVGSEKYLQSNVTIVDSIIEAPTRFFFNAADSSISNMKYVSTTLWVTSNTTMSNLDLTATYMTGVWAWGVTAILIDCKLGSDLGAKLYQYNGNGVEIVKYNVALDIKDNAGNSVLEPNLKIVDSYGTVVYNDTYSGSDILLEVYSEENVASDLTITDHNPFTFTITKSGYSTYTTIMDVKEKIEWEIALQPPRTVIKNSELYGTILY